MSDFRAYCDQLLARVREAGWEIVNEKALPYGRQFGLLQHGVSKAVLSCYQGKKGLSFVPGGKHAAELREILGGGKKKSPQAPACWEDPFGLGTPRIGGDESGKGDYFGPLVVAAWRLEAADLERLKALGVGDSKAIADTKIERIAGQLEAMGQGVALRLMPRAYNARYSEIGNLNHLLSEMHGACVRRLLERGEKASKEAPRVVLIDQYARDVSLLERRAQLPAGCRLVTRTKGEADPAVAAASILARAAFVKGLRELSHEFGHPFPSGAGNPVLESAREFVATFGQERLAEVAKVHFATTQKL